MYGVAVVGRSIGRVDYAIPGTPAVPTDSHCCHFIYRSASALHGTFNSPRHPSNYPDNATFFTTTCPRPWSWSSAAV